MKRCQLDWTSADRAHVSAEKSHLALKKSKISNWRAQIPKPTAHADFVVGFFSFFSNRYTGYATRTSLAQGGHYSKISNIYQQPLTCSPLCILLGHFVNLWLRSSEKLYGKILVAGVGVANIWQDLIILLICFLHLILQFHGLFSFRLTTRHGKIWVLKIIVVWIFI